MTVGDIVGRNVALAAVDRFLDRLMGAPAAIVFAGEPGIGKTTVWRQVLERAAERPVTVLSCRPVEAETKLAFASLAVDFGHVYVVKSELRAAADAAARYGVTGIEGGVTTAQNYAVDAANDNTADGTAVVIDPATDVEFLSWNKSNGTYTVLSGAARSTANALRVTARRTVAGQPSQPDRAREI